MKYFLITFSIYTVRVTITFNSNWNWIVEIIDGPKLYLSRTHTYSPSNNIWFETRPPHSGQILNELWDEMRVYFRFLPYSCIHRRPKQRNWIHKTLTTNEIIVSVWAVIKLIWFVFFACCVVNCKLQQKRRYVFIWSL